MDNDMKYFVNKERGVVVCVLYKCRLIPQKRIYKALTAKDWEYISVFCDPIPDTFVGKAQCAPEDVFDEEIGKQIARTRAQNARRKAINNEIDAAVSRMAMCIRKIELKTGAQSPSSTK